MKKRLMVVLIILLSLCSGCTKVPKEVRIKKYKNGVSELAFQTAYMNKIGNLTNDVFFGQDFILEDGYYFIRHIKKNMSIFGINISFNEKASVITENIKNTIAYDKNNEIICETFNSGNIGYYIKNDDEVYYLDERDKTISLIDSWVDIEHPFIANVMNFDKYDDDLYYVDGNVFTKITGPIIDELALQQGVGVQFITMVSQVQIEKNTIKYIYYTKTELTDAMEISEDNPRILEVYEKYNYTIIDFKDIKIEKPNFDNYQYIE